MSAEATYLDSSAIVKLIISEPGSESLAHASSGWGPLVSSKIAHTEVRRALLRAGVQDAVRCAEVLESIGLVAVSDEVLSKAATMLPATLRSLDAIHIATASLLGNDLAQLCTYDLRMAAAAEAAGLAVVTPG